jgi:hypothetical protein
MIFQKVFERYSLLRDALTAAVTVGMAVLLGYLILLVRL